MSKRKRYPKVRTGKIKGVAHRGNRIEFGEYGVKSLEPYRLTAKQIEAIRQCARRETKRSGKLWIRVYPDVPVTKKPLETRMGKGKGSVEYYVSKIKPGTILFEMGGVPRDLAMMVFEKVKGKLPVKVKFIEDVI